MQQTLLGLEPPEKIDPGIEGLEHITMGGLTKGRATLLVGTSGSGKTLFAMEFLYRALTKLNKTGVFVTMEETAADIVRNVKKLEWDLEDLLERDQLRIIDASPEPVEVTETGPYDLTGFFVHIQNAVRQIGAEFLVIDSVGSLFSQFSQTNMIRFEIFRVIHALKEMGVTSIITAERLEEYGPISRHGVEEFVVDNVIVLRNVLVEEKCRRTIQILKMRGESHYKGEFPLTIDSRGINIIPLSAMELKQASSSKRISFGNRKLDEMTDGGLFRDSIILCSGPTGGGKTLMCTTFVGDACRNGERVLLLAYEESREQLVRNALSWNVDFQKWEAEGLLEVICLYPEAMGLEDHLLMIRREIAAFQPQRLVMDSVSAMERVSSVRNFREFVIGLTSYVKQQEVCSLFTSTTPRLSGGDSITEAHISTITDAIVLLRYVEIDGILRRGIAVIKMRGSQHDKEIREFTIDDKGLHIGAPFKNVQNILLGVPSSSGRSDVEHLEEMFQH